MPLWLFVPLILVALLACPLSMWVMSKVTRRKAACPLCLPGMGEQHQHSVQELEARKVALEQEMRAIEAEMDQGQARPVEGR